MASKQIEDTYPLSPTQQGMLFHALYAPQTGVYVDQMRCTLRGDLDVDAFGQAWQQVVDRHPALRSAFAWKRLARPLQVVGRRVALPVRRLDWRDTPPSEQRARLEAYCEEDRRQGFDLSRAPLLRVIVIQLADEVFAFVWTSHHLLLDGWSAALTLKEVFALYAAQRRGEALQLDPAPPYRAYIAWLQRQDPAAARAFWRRALAGVGAPTPLGVDQQAPRAATGPPTAKRRLALSAEATSALPALARQRALTLNTILLGAWALLLSRYSGSEEVTFGATVSGRPPDLPGVRQMVGLFIATLPARVRVPPGAPLPDWLLELQDQQADARQYAYSSLSDIQGWIGAPRGQPLFESIVVFENYPAATALAAAGAQIDLAIGEIGSAEQSNYPLALIATPGERLDLQISYDRQRFDDATIVRLLRHVQTLIGGILADPDRRLEDLPILADAERHQLLVEWNDTAAASSQRPCMHDLFAAQAACRPDAIALSAEGRQLSYGELERRANQLAHELQRRRVGPDSLVGICMQRSLDLVVATLGVVKAGGAYVPLDPAYPAERIRFMLEDTAAPLILAHRGLDASLPAGAAQTLALEALRDALARAPAHAPRSSAAADNLACVLYTSGSTGRPKGAAILQRGVVRIVKDAGYARLTADQTFLHFAPFAFDASTFELWGCLLNGARLVIFPPHAPTLSELGRTFRRERITIAWLTAGLFAQLVEKQLDSLQQLDQALSGGDVLSAPHVRKLLEQPGRRVVMNAYGPTENSTFTSFHPMRSPDEVERSLPIGRPIADTQAYLLDRRMRPVPIGVVGELYVGGGGLARGYLNRPGQTAAAFVPNLFNEGSGVRGQGSDPDPRSPIPDPRIYRTGDLARWPPNGSLSQGSGRRGQGSDPDPRSPIPDPRIYRTGDLARYRPDGGLEFVGRVDGQIKLRGFRVELGEIMAVLAQHPSVRDCVVVARADALGDKRLVGYVVPRAEDGGLTIDDSNADAPAALSPIFDPQSPELREWLAARLPEYMIPSAFVALDALPLTANGKLDRSALPAPERILEGAGGFVAPRTPVERTIAGIWAETLGCERVGVEDTFFALGGHSLLAAHMIDRLNQTFLLELPLRQLFETPTVAGIAEVVERVAAEQAADAARAQLLAAVEGLTADEVRALLASEQSEGS